MTDSPFGSESLKSSADKLRQEFDRLLGSAWEQGERAWEAFRSKTPGTVWVPRANVVETEDSICVLLDLAGIPVGEIDVSLVGHMLTVKGERLNAIADETEDVTTRLNEIQLGRFERSIPMPVAVDSDSVSASSKDGLLRISLDKAEQAKPTHIPVNAVE